MARQNAPSSQALSSKSEVMAFLTVVEEYIELAGFMGLRRRDVSFLLGFRGRVDTLPDHKKINMDALEGITHHMVENEGWRMGVIDRYVMNQARQVSDEWRNTPKGIHVGPERRHRSKAKMVSEPAIAKPKKSAPSVEKQ
jgi:hypothetical protein